MAYFLSFLFFVLFAWTFNGWKCYEMTLNKSLCSENELNKNEVLLVIIEYCVERITKKKWTDL